MSIISHNLDKLGFVINAENKVVGLIARVEYKLLYDEFSGDSHPDYPGFRLLEKISSVTIWDELSSDERTAAQKVFDGVNTVLTASDYSIVDEASGSVSG